MVIQRAVQLRDPRSPALTSQGPMGRVEDNNHQNYTSSAQEFFLELAGFSQSLLFLSKDKFLSFSETKVQDKSIFVQCISYFPVTDMPSFNFN